MFGSINLVEIFSSFIVMAAIIDIFGSIPIFVSMKEQNKTIKAGQACLTALEQGAGKTFSFFTQSVARSSRTKEAKAAPASCLSPSH